MNESNLAHETPPSSEPPTRRTTGEGIIKTDQPRAFMKDFPPGSVTKPGPDMAEAPPMATNLGEKPIPPLPKGAPQEAPDFSEPPETVRANEAVSMDYPRENPDEATADQTLRSGKAVHPVSPKVVIRMEDAQEVTGDEETIVVPSSSGVQSIEEHLPPTLVRAFNRIKRVLGGL